MSNCKHDISYLIGTADGIMCRKCGAMFKSFDEIRHVESMEAEPAPEKPAIENKPKRGRSKKS